MSFDCLKKLIPVIIGVILLITVLYFVGIQNIISILSKINLYYFLLAIVSYLFVEIFAMLKLKFVSKLSFSKLFFSHMGGMFLSQITPGRIGYTYTAYSIAKKENKSISKLVGAIGLIQGVMIATKIVAIIFALLYFSFITEVPSYMFLSFITPALIVFFVVFILYTEKSKKIFSKVPFLKKTIRYVDLMQESVRKITKKTMLYMVFFDLLGWFFYGIVFYFLVLSLNNPIDFLTCLMLQPLLSALMFIPISPSALGIAETGSGVVFSLINVDLFAFGVAFLLLLRINNIIVDSFGLVDFKDIRLNEIFKKIKNKKL